MNARVQLLVALAVGSVAAVVARAFGFTNLATDIATGIGFAVLFWGGFWWFGRNSSSK